MLIPNHPDEELLSAYASGDADALADARLSGHLTSCIRCTDLVNELGALRASLAELPDIAPPRPLRLLPDVEPARVGSVAGWARRFFAPVLTAGAALAMVGIVGTAAPALTQSAGGAALELDASSERAAASSSVPLSGAGGESLGPASSSGDSSANEPEVSGSDDGEFVAHGDGDGTEEVQRAAADVAGSPWTVLLVTGVALMLAAVLLRFAVVPRAG